MENVPKNLVGLMADQNPNQLIGVLGILKSGNGFVPIDPDYPTERIRFIVGDSGIDILVTESKYLNKALQISSGAERPLKHIVCLDRTEETVSIRDGTSIHFFQFVQKEVRPSPQQKNTLGPGRIAYLVYTSGSTGKPKAVAITHENIFPLLSWCQQFLLYGEQTRTLQSLSFSFDFGVFEVLATVVLGGTLFCIDKNDRMDPTRYAELANLHEVNTIHSTPSFFNELASMGCRMKTLEQLHLGGEALLTTAVDNLFDMIGESCVLNNWYGPSETTVNSSIFTLGTQITSTGKEFATVPIGKASAKNTLYILDRHCNLLPARVSGELCIGGPGLAPAYLDRADLTAQKFVPSSLNSEPGAKLYKTGDLVRSGPDGNIEFLGRLDHQVKVRGFRIELGEIEAALVEHVSVREAVVLALEEQPGRKQLVAYFVPDSHSGPSNSDLRTFLKLRLPDYMVPTAYVTLSSLPLTSNGKLDRHALPAPTASKSTRQSEAPDFSHPAEEVIAGVCAEVLGINEVGINDNLFDLGCHSLLATKIVLRLRTAFGVELPLVRFFEYPTVAGLAYALERERSSGDLLEIPHIEPAPRNSSLPLSFAQERVWFLSQLDPASVSYHVPRALRIKGRFSAIVLEHSFTELIRRHEILRTNFADVDGRPVQLIRSPAPIELRLYDLQSLTDVESARVTQEYIVEEGRRPFELTRDPLLRLSLLIIGREVHVLVLTEHHLVHDGWTQGVLIADFLALYRCMSQGVISSLAEPSLQYADFAYWQRRWLQGKALEKRLSYWRQQMAGAPPVLDLALDRSRPRIQSYQGAEYRLIIDGSLAKALRATSRTLDATLFMTMLTVFKVMLFRYTAREDLIVGSWVANRAAREIEGLLGMIINTIVLRTDLSGNPSLLCLVKRVRNVCLGAYAHQDLPFERLVEELQPGRSLSYNPLFQVLFAFQDTSTPALNLPGIEIEVIDAHNRSAKFDLNVVVLPHREQLLGQSAADATHEITFLIEYSTDLFERETVRRMARHYKTLLEGFVTDQNRNIADIDMLTEGEARQLLEDWNATAARYPDDKSVQELFEEQTERSPDAVAVVYEESQLSYRRLNRSANQLAHRLREMGAGPEVRIGLCLQRGLDMLVGLLGILKTGGAYVPVDPDYPAERLTYILRDSGARVVVTCQRFAEKLGRVRVGTMHLDEDWEQTHSLFDCNPASQGERENLAYVIYTSGSTGRPKGVGVSRSALTNFATAFSRRIGLLPIDVLVAVTSLTFDISVLEFFVPIISGARVVVADEETVKDGYLLKALMIESEATHLQATPATWRMLVEAGWTGGAITRVLCGGEALPADLATELTRQRAQVWNLYGPTETTVWSSMWAVETNGKTGERRGLVPIGQPIDNTQVYILNERLHPAPVGVCGELYIGGAGLSRGYLSRPDLTAQSFIPDPFRELAGRLYRTGDLGWYGAGGTLQYGGRRDNQVKIRGHRVEPGEVESLLNAHSGVRQSAVTAHEDPFGDKLLIAHFVPSDHLAPTGSQLREYMRDHVPDYMVPSVFLELQDLPLTTSGKVDRKVLSKYSALDIPEEKADSLTPLQETLTRIFAELLGLEGLGAHQNFFEVGGHSLLATRVISRIRAALGVDLSLRRFFETPTAAGLAAAVATEINGGAEFRAGPINVVSRDEPILLSFAQQRLWFIQQMEPESVAYNIPHATRLRGGLELSALRQSLGEIANRHDVLRTRFEWRGEQPVQLISEAPDVPLAVWDLSDLPEYEREQRARQIAGEDAARPFDLGHGPVWRAGVVRLAAEENVLVLCIHHVASDGWSTGVLIKELSLLYEGYREGSDVSLPDLPVQYADFAAWQRGWLQGEVLENQMEYWRRQLAGVPRLELPTDRPRPPSASHRGGALPFRLPGGLTDDLKVLSRREGVTLFMTLLATFEILLGRYAGQEDLVVGTNVANRNRLETEGLIGFFINQLVLRTDLSGNPRFCEMLRRVRETTLGAYSHQDIPFEKVVEELAPERDLVRSPLFQVVFALQNPPDRDLRVAGIEFGAFGGGRGVAKFDLMLNLMERKEGVGGVVEYATDLYDRSTIERLMGHLRHVFEQIVASPEGRIGELAFLSWAERQQMSVEWNDTERSYAEAGKLHELFERQVERTSEAVAVVYGEQQLSYFELNEAANRLAHYLAREGVGAEILVGLCMERSLEMVIGLLGALKAGGAYVPMDPSYPKDRLAYILEDSEAPVLLTQKHLVAELPDYKGKAICVDEGWLRNAESRPENPKVDVSPHALAYVIYTSGSTGRPKGVAIEQHSTVGLLRWAREVFTAKDMEGVLGSTSISFDLSVFELFLPLSCGGTVILVENLLDLPTTPASQQVSLINTVPSAMEQLLRIYGIPHSVRTVNLAGEALRGSLVEEIRQCKADLTVYNLYGPSEDTTYSTFALMGREGEESPSIGRAIADSQVYVLDKEWQGVPIGVPGELFTGGEGVARGYLNRPDLTVGKFIPDSISANPGARLYRTGDQVRWGTDGELEYLGRLDHQVKLRGYRIELGEIEAVLSQHAGVRQCAVMVREDVPGNKRLVGYIVVSGEVALATAELRGYLIGKLPEYMVPSAFVELSELPLTSNGKLDRRALPVPQVQDEQVQEEEPRSPVEEIVAGIWCEVLRVDRVGMNQNFFELGGHSLLATQVISRIREVLQVEVPLRALFERSTVNGLAEAVYRERAIGKPLEGPPMKTVSREGVLPLSFAQQRLWFIQQMEPESVAYNIPHATRLRGGLELSALRQSLGEIANRHDVLRTRFEWRGEQPVQLISEAPDVPLAVWDLSDLPEYEREQRARQIAGEDAARPFDLGHGPVWRAGVVRLAAEENVLVLCIHHVASDGWSTGVLIKELSLLYEGYREGSDVSLPDLPVQYADFAAWQRGWLQGEVLENQMEYWRRQLAGVPRLELPTDRPRPPSASHRGGALPFRLPGGLTDDLKVLSRREGVTLFMTLLATFEILLGRYAGQEDLVVGTNVANRNRLETEGLIGFFINQLVLRTDLSGNPRFCEMLRRVRETTLGAYSHQDIPFEKVVEELAPERDLVRSPLFQVVFALQNPPDRDLRVAGIEFGAFGGGRGVAKFDLMLNLMERKEGVGGVVEYATDLYDRSTIERLMGHLRHVFEQIVASPEGRIGELAFLSWAERQQMSVEWNDTERSYAEAGKLHELFERQVERTSEAVAVVYGEQQLSYFELNEAANRLAHYLAREGVGAEILVGLCMERSLEMVIGLLGALKAGGAYVPMDPSYPKDRLAYILEDSEAPVLLTQKHLVAELPDYKGKAICVDEGWLRNAESRPENPKVDVSPHALAYVIYTSGSTGRPKGVAIEQHSTVGLLRWAREVFTAKDMEGVLGSTSISFDLSVFELFLPLSCGGTVILVENLLDLPTTPASQQVSLINTVPSAMEQLLRIYGIPHSVRTVNLAGEALRGSLVEEIRQCKADLTVYNLYGPSEDTTYSTFALMGREGEESPSIGRAIADSQVYVLDKEWQGVPIGVPGELFTGGEGVARGYLNRPDLTVGKFIPDSISANPGARLYRTGDQVRWGTDGELEYLGRLDHQVKLRGYRIELGEIEAVLSQHAGVRQCAVMVREDVPGNKRLVGYIVVSGEVALATAELRGYLIGKLPEYMVPSAFVELSELPLTSNGKLDRRALPVPQVQDEQVQEEEPRSPVEEIVAGIWCEVLRVDRVGMNQNFFELGGHSLLATQVISRIREVLSVDIPLRSMFETPTAAGLAAAVIAERSGGAKLQPGPIKAVSRGQELPLSFAQQRLWFVHRLNPESPAYNIPLAVRIRGLLHTCSLIQGLQRVVLRHEALRTRFEARDGWPIQIIDDVGDIDPAWWDISSLEEAERERWIQELGRLEGELTFDLLRGPLMRVKLLRLGVNEHVLLVTLHHIATDGWSLGLLVRELARDYQAFQAGETSPLPELEIQYADFAIWQRASLSGEVFEEQMSYWRKQLAGLVMLDMPKDRQRTSAVIERADRVPFGLETELSQKLKQMSVTEGITLFMTLLAGFQILLARYSGQEDVAIGTPIGGRNRAETEALIGLFVNTLVLRMNLGGNPTVRELLERVREMALDAYAHQDLPFDKLIEELNPDRSLSEQPLLQVMFAFQNAPDAPLKLPNLRIASEAIERRGAARFDLTLSLWEENAEILGWLEYPTDQFEKESVERLLLRLRRVLERIVVDKNHLVTDLPLMTPAEWEQILVQWNRTESEYSTEKLINQRLEEQVVLDEDAIAITDEAQALTYGELNRSANRLAHKLIARGVGPEVMVGIYIDRSVDMVAGLLGVLKAGAAYVPLDPGYPAERLSFMITDAQLRLVVTREQRERELTELAPQIESLTTDATGGLSSEANPPARAVSENLAYVIYTSGSTGLPKGVQITHKALLNLVTWHRQVRAVKPDDRATQISSLAFDASVWELWPHLTAGASVHLPDEIVRISPLELRDWLVSRGVTISFLPTPLAESLLSLKWPAQIGLRTLLTGGDWLHAISGEPLPFDLVNNYGPTENTVVATSCRVHSQSNKDVPPPIGQPIANTHVYLLDRDLNPVLPGVAGEIHIGGDGIARGYLMRPGLTAEKFIPDHICAEPGNRLYRTGDRARYRADGNIDFLGRMDYQTKIRGLRIELGEIESVLQEHPDIRNAVVVARNFPPTGLRLVAYLVSNVDQKPMIDGLREHLRRKLPEFMLPTVYVWLETLPMTSNGKVNRHALPDPGSSGGSEPTYAAPRGPVQEVLAQIWCAVLGVERVGVHDNFFDVGGHSLLLIQLLSRVNAAFCVEMPLRVLFERPTIHQLGVAIAAEQMKTVDSREISQMIKEIQHLHPSEISLLL
jgi:amino acid adenylation domain-containing protein